MGKYIRGGAEQDDLSSGLYSLIIANSELEVLYVTIRILAFDLPPASNSVKGEHQKVCHQLQAERLHMSIRRFIPVVEYIEMKR